MRVAFYTLGCKVNQYETEVLSARFAAAGFDVVAGHAPGCDVYVVGSCTVTAEGDRKTRQAVRRFRRENPGAIVVLTGCYPQAFPKEAAAIPEADIVTGARNRAGGVASPLNTVAFTAAAFVTALQDARTCASPAAGAAGRAGASSEQPTARARQNPKTTPTARDSLTEFRIRGLYHKTASATETVRRVRALPRGGASLARSPE